MKKYFYKSGLRFAVIALVLAASAKIASAQIYTEEKRIVKSFVVSSATTVDIENKYGKLHVVPWEKDSVRIEIDISLKSESEERIEKFKSEINFNFTETPTYLIAHTEIGAKRGSILDDIKDIKNNLSTSEYEVMIDFKVFVPKYINLKLRNKYGDIYTSDLNGNVTIRLSNGDLKASSFKGESDIEVKFGDAVINAVTNARVNLYFAEIYIKKAGSLNIDSKSSKINLDDVSSLKTISKRDKFYIKKMKTLSGSSSFSDFWLYSINGEASFNVKYGSMNFEKISKSFSFLNLTSRYTDLNLYFEKGSAYQLDITHEETDIVYPVNLGTLEKKRLPENKKQFLSYGKIGSADSKAKVNINCTEGNLNIFHN